MQITTIGLDLAKNVFHVVCFDKQGKLVRKRMLRRSEVSAFFAKLPPCCVSMESCASSHYWSRQFSEFGHDVKLIPPQYVKPYLRGNKNDYNDACAIAEASTRPLMPTVAVKSVDQQDMQALHRLRSKSVRDRTGFCNCIRGLLGEYGIVFPKGISTLRRKILELLEDTDNRLSNRFRKLLSHSYNQLVELDANIDFYTEELQLLSQQDEACQRLQTVPGFGPIVASAFRSAIGDGSSYARARDASASLGLVPRQHSSGGKDNLLGISKRGDKYLRGLLIHGARAVVIRARGKDDRLSRWITRICQERGHNKAVVALANKMARIGLAILKNNTTYQPQVMAAK